VQIHLKNYLPAHLVVLAGNNLISR